MLESVISGAIAGGVAVIVLALVKRVPPCPQCGARPPRFRKPRDTKESLWGGWTCAQCGCQFDRPGRMRTEKEK